MYTETLTSLIYHKGSQQNKNEAQLPSVYHCHSHITALWQSVPQPDGSIWSYREAWFPTISQLAETAETARLKLVLSIFTNK